VTPEAKLIRLGVHQLPAIEKAANRANASGSHRIRAPTQVTFTPAPFKFPATIPRRQFIYGRHYIRGFLSATVAPGGVGKSSLALVDAVAMTAGRDLHCIVPPKAIKVWYVNLEDPREEIERRVAAICLHFGIEGSEVEERLFFDGREIEIILASQHKSGAIVATSVADALCTALKANRIDVLILDPFVSAHRVTENDNGAIDAVAKTLGRIAGAANCAIECVHHTRKNNGAEITAEDGRGASALVAAARSVRVLNRMSEAEAAKAGMAAEERRSYFRSEIDKANLALAAKAIWYRMASVALGNGSGGAVDDQDYIAVATPWAWLDASEGVSTADLRAVQAAISAGRWRENSQAADWAGKAIAQVLNLDLTNKAHKAKVNALLKTWILSGALVVVDGRDARHEVRSFIEVGTAADD
jgi:AAA domain